MTTMFVDMRAVFDSIDREVLVRTIRERGLREDVVKRRRW